MKYFVRHLREGVFNCITLENNLFKVTYFNGESYGYYEIGKPYTEVSKEVYLEHLTKLYLQNL